MHLCFTFPTSPGLLFGSAWWHITGSFRRSQLSFCLLGIGRRLAFAFVFYCTNLVHSKGWGTRCMLELGHDGISYSQESGGGQGSVGLAVNLSHHWAFFWYCVQEDNPQTALSKSTPFTMRCPKSMFILSILGWGLWVDESFIKYATKDGLCIGDIDLPGHAHAFTWCYLGLHMRCCTHMCAMISTSLSQKRYGCAYMHWGL